MKEPEWHNVTYEKPKLQELAYYSAPRMKPVLNSLDEADPEILRTFQKLGIPVEEQKVLLNVAGASASPPRRGTCPSAAWPSTRCSTPCPWSPPSRRSSASSASSS